jgi:HK97 gp10 family phage protein
MAKVHDLDGYNEAKKMLQELDKVTQKKVVLSVLRKSSRPIINSAKSKVRPTSKRVASSIRFSQIRSAKKIAGSIKPRGKDAWFAHFIEFGTSGIVKKAGGYKRSSDNPAFGWVGKLARGRRYRVDQTEKPFMRPAIAEKKGETKRLINRGFIDDIQKLIKKFKK